jgi:hypothetical protein
MWAPVTRILACPTRQGVHCATSMLVHAGILLIRCDVICYEADLVYFRSVCLTVLRFSRTGCSIADYFCNLHGIPSLLFAIIVGQCTKLMVNLSGEYMHNSSIS